MQSGDKFSDSLPALLRQTRLMPFNRWISDADMVNCARLNDRAIISNVIGSMMTPGIDRGNGRVQGGAEINYLSQRSSGRVEGRTGTKDANTGTRSTTE